MYKTHTWFECRNLCKKVYLIHAKLQCVILKKRCFFLADAKGNFRFYIRWHDKNKLKVSCYYNTMYSTSFFIFEQLCTLSPPIDPATHSISATTTGLFRGIFWWVTSLNVSHWSKCVMHVVIFTINNDKALTSFSQCTSTGEPTDWLVNSGLFTAFSHELSQIVLRHYTRNVIDIVVCAITNNWMANNARKLHIWYNFLNRTMKLNGTLKTCRVIMCLVAEILVV